MCIQETWFNDQNIVHIPDYHIVTKNRKTTGGGCAIYIHKSIPFKTVNNDSSDEYQQVDIYLNKYVLSVINFYNPCSRLSECKLQTLFQ